MPHIQTDDNVSLYVEEAGQGTALVFAHEFAGDYRSWAPQVRYFSRRYRCITYSARGYTPSEVPPDVASYSQQRARDDLRCVMDALGIERAHVVGLSMGAFAALHFGMAFGTAESSARALSLTLAGVGTGSHPAAYANFQREALALADTIAREGMQKLAQTYGHGPARVQFRAKDPQGFAEFVQRLAEHPAVGSANTMRGYQAKRPSLYDLTDAIGAIKVPTLIMTGDEDEPCLEPSLMLKRAITTSQLAVLPGAGHAINLEEPESFNRLLAEFLAQVEQGAKFERDAHAKPMSILGPGA